MHILVLGAGAIGSLFGARLSNTGAQVSLLTTDRLHVEAVQGQGLHLEELDGSLRLFRIPAYHDAREISLKADLVLVAVKTYDTREALTSIQNCCDSSTLFLTIQNGIGNFERVSKIVGADSVLMGVTAQGATMVEPGRIRHGGNGPSRIGEVRGQPSPRVESLVRLFRQAGLQAESSDRMEQLIWEKLVVNVGINAITALTGIPNGVIAQQDEARELSIEAVREAILVAQAQGFSMPEDMPERVIAVARATAVNRSSMGQDVDRKSQTEIDAINGAIVRMGQGAHIPTPVNRTLTLLIKTLERNYG